MKNANKKYNKKLEKIVELISHLDLDWINDREGGFKPNGFENDYEIAEKILASLGYSKPVSSKEWNGNERT